MCPELPLFPAIDYNSQDSVFQSIIYLCLYHAIIELDKTLSIFELHCFGFNEDLSGMTDSNCHLLRGRQIFYP